MTAFNRRDFLKSAAVGSAAALSVTLEDRAEAARAALPQRVLRRAKVRVSMIGYGMGPMGSDNTSFQEAETLIRAAMDLGVTYLDVSPDYGDAEAKLKAPLKGRRNQAFLVTKVNPQSQSREGVQRQLEASLRRMGVDHVDAVHIHNLGDFDMDLLFKPEGAVAGLKEARKRGLCKFIGVSGHMRPHRFATAIDSGEIDLAMMALNFADRFNYDFEGLALPACKKQGTAVVAMKVLGGARNWAYDAKTPATLADYHERAIRYSLSLPGVASAVIGFSTAKEIRAAVEVAKAYKPLSEAERTALLQEGRQLARSRGLYYGPVMG